MPGAAAVSTNKPFYDSNNNGSQSTRACAVSEGSLLLRNVSGPKTGCVERTIKTFAVTPNMTAAITRHVPLPPR